MGRLGSIIPLLLLASLSVALAKRYHTDRDKEEDSGRTKRMAYSNPKNTLEDKDFWNNLAQAELTNTLNYNDNTNIAKNVIIFLGDGMGNPTIVAARIYKGQEAGVEGAEETQLVFESFPHVALSKTYCVNKQVADSASTGTAYLTGVKTNYATLGVDATVAEGDCTSVTEENKVASIASWALQENKRAGFVTSTRVTHATPGASYAHTADRDWECDQDIQAQMAACPTLKDIARQLIEDEPGRSFNVIMGGGYQVLTANATDHPGDPVDEDLCQRQDGLDLFQQWQTNKAAEGKSYVAARSRTELMGADLTGVESLLGIFGNSHVPYEYEKRELGLDLPTLSEMTRRAIDVLNQGEDGFFLLVEGGRIDHAHHDTVARIALDETLAFDEAVQTALSMVDLTETLIVVTADHSHTMSIGGYADRGNDIMGFAGNADDDLPYTTLMYTNGPGFNFTTDTNGTVVRYDLTNTNTSTFDYVQLSPVPRSSETHGGEDVGIYAIGPMSHLFRGVHQQNYIAHAMGYSACMGPNKGHCNGARTFTVSMPLFFVLSCLLVARNFFV